MAFFTGHRGPGCAGRLELVDAAPLMCYDNSELVSAAGKQPSASAGDRWRSSHITLLPSSAMDVLMTREAEHRTSTHYDKN